MLIILTVISHVIWNGEGRSLIIRRAATTFPKKLHLMLSNPELSHAITWMPHGRCWRVLDKELLMQEGNPVYFTQTRFESFTRQLSSWGFKR